MGMNLDQREVMALEEQDEWIKRAVEAERDASYATDRAIVYINRTADLQDSVKALSCNVERLRDQRNVALALLAVAYAALIYMAVRG